MTWEPLEDDEGARVPEGVRVIDAHVHLFADRVFDAIWRWFDEHAWEIRYRFAAQQVDRFLTDRGVERYLALHYARAPGMAEELNSFVLDFAHHHRRCIPCATVLPGEPEAEALRVVNGSSTDSVVAFEDPLPLGARYALAAILDKEFELPVARRRTQHDIGCGDGVAQGIVEQVVNHAAPHASVSRDAGLHGCRLDEQVSARFPVALTVLG